MSWERLLKLPVAVLGKGPIRAVAQPLARRTITGHPAGDELAAGKTRPGRDRSLWCNRWRRGRRSCERILVVKKYLLFDHDGVLVDTEVWYFKAGARALAGVGMSLDEDQYLYDMSQGLGTWSRAKAAGVDERTIDRLRQLRNEYYQEYLRTEPIEIAGVVETLTELSTHVRMGIVTTAKRADFEVIHEKGHIRQFMDFILVREDYRFAKPHPEPYLTGLQRFGATKEEALVVEDSARGLNSAVAAGIDCAVVHNAFTQGQDFSQATYRINTLTELKKIVLDGS